MCRQSRRVCGWKFICRHVYDFEGRSQGRNVKSDPPNFQVSLYKKRRRFWIPIPILPHMHDMIDNRPNYAQLYVIFNITLAIVTADNFSRWRLVLSCNDICILCFGKFTDAASWLIFRIVKVLSTRNGRCYLHRLLYLFVQRIVDLVELPTPYFEVVLLSY